jgi:hypothetical protein
MNSLRIWVLGALCLGFAGACAQSRGAEAGTNTNWLKRCTASADCNGNGDCLCGVCTLSCSGSSACAEVGSQTSCVPLSQAPRCATSASGSACLPPDSEADAGLPLPIADAGLGLTRVGTEVQVTDRYRSCAVDDDCLLVDTSCNGCCGRDAIRAQDQEAYQTNFAQACSGYQGPICDCQPPDLVPLCQEGLCRALPRDQARDCFSPTQNVTRAYDPGAVGCACEQAGLAICVGGAALICTESAAATTWVAGQDGPCESGATDCPVNSRRPDADACLAEFATCFARQAGGFCGMGCRGPLECHQVDECGFSPFDLSQCGKPFPAFWEGSCGDIHYRASGGGFGGATLYWSAATGEVVAMTTSSDTPGFCNGAEFEITRGDIEVVQTCPAVFDATTALCPQ